MTPLAESRFACDAPPAVVVGLCGHGLALVRALHAGGVRVLGIEANDALPGVRTRLAAVVKVPSIHGEGLLESLLALRQRIECPGLPVLFLTNDSMVRTLGQRWPALEGHYALSWAESRARLTPLLDKPALEARCRQTGMDYPRTFVLQQVGDVGAAVAAIGFPMIVKPARPLSGFKTALPDSAAALQALAERFSGDLPFLVQQFVPGDDRSIHFSALYLDQGRELARFDGRKLRSRPMGHTTIGEACPDDAVYAQTRRFFDGLALSGPVSLELKRGPDGRLWVIEPTIGRTDFWIGLCVENGVNLPLLEYRHQAGLPLPATAQRDDAVWFNEDRDPGGRWWLAGRNPPSLGSRRASYVYLHRADPGPAMAFLAQAGRYYAAALGRRLRRWLGVRDAAGSGPTGRATALPEVQAWPDWPSLQASFAGSAPTATASLFQTPEWFEVLDRSCALPDARTVLMGVGAPVAPTILPLRLRGGQRAESLANYYAALYGPIGGTGPDAAAHADALAQWLAREGIATLRLHPVDAAAGFWRDFTAALRRQGYWVDDYFAFGNWYQPCTGLRWTDYLAQRPSRLRHTILRTQRKLARDPGYRLRVLDATARPEDMDAAVADFKRVYAHSWKKPEPYPTFIDNLCRMAHARGWLRIGVCELDGQAVSAQIWLVREGVASIFKLAYDGRYARQGVGTAVSAAMWEQVLDRDQVDEVDFLAGDDDYKAEWMAQRRERQGIVAFRRQFGLGPLLAAQHYGARVLKRLLIRPPEAGAA